MNRFLASLVAIKNWLSKHELLAIVIFLVGFYLIVNYVVFPLLYAYSSVTYISAVVSSSMDHSSPTINLTYNLWLTQHNFNSSVTASWPFYNGISLGSLVVAYKVAPSDIKVGDIVIFFADVQGTTEDVIHRVINETVINGTYYYTTKGDANAVSGSFEINVPYKDIVGEVETVIPYLGYPRYLLYLLGNAL